MRDILYGGALLLVLAAVYGVRRWLDARIQQGVQARFDREAKEFEHRLALLAERERFDFQRRITDFSILVAQRHEKYAELWRLARRAHGRIIDLARYRPRNFDYFDST